jgi:hypothetical protein
MSCSGGESEEVLPEGVPLIFLGDGAPLLDEAFRGSMGASVGNELVRISSRY